MSGVPGIRLRGLDYAIDALESIEKWLAAERLGLADTLGTDAPPVKRMYGKLSYVRIVIAHLKDDKQASCDTHPKDGDSTEIEAPLVSGAVGATGAETPKV